MNSINEAHEAVEEEFSEPSKRSVVVPGEIVVSGEDYLPGEGVRREGENVVASRFGLAEQLGRVVKVIPLTGAYVPRRNNVVIGRITDVLHNGWLSDIDCPGNGFLPIAESPRFINQYEMDQFLAIGDIISAKIWSIKGRGIDLTIKGKGLGKLEGGFIFRVSPSRVPRIIGREGSMIGLIKDNTGCSITLGQNGWVWINGPDTEAMIRARKAVQYIADNVHIGGLTDHMDDWFKKN
ncbi:MAG: KH domain-containing protein [Nanoarchaeota archaeon]